MLRRFAPLLLLGVSATMVGMAVGYYVAMTGGLPISEGVLVIIALTFVALLAAFHGGRSRGGTEPQSPSLNKSWDALRRELERSRRFERSFVLMRVPAGGALEADNGSVAEAQPALGALPLVLRGIDEAWTMQGSTYMVLPESTRASAMSLLARLRSTMPDAAVLEGVQIAQFPEDGLTTGALVASLRPVPASGDAPPVRLVPAGAGVGLRRDERTG